MTNLTTETRRRGERSGDLGIRRFPDLRLCFQNAWSIIRSTLREIFDESAYDRFLQRTKVPRSVASYQAFMRDRETTMAKKPRCC